MVKLATGTTVKLWLTAPPRSRDTAYRGSAAVSSRRTVDFVFGAIGSRRLLRRKN